MLMEDLNKYQQDGIKQPNDCKIGLEYEMFVVDKHNKPIPYKNGIEKILTDLLAYSWQPIKENNYIISLHKDESYIHLEPGGQLELATKPLTNIHEICTEVNEYETNLNTIIKKYNYSILKIGVHPTASREEINFVPKDRYKIMKQYMQKVGTKGLDMMLRTCTVQTALDYCSEQDAIIKMRIAVALQPIIMALWANSPLIDGKINNYQSYRNHIWENTDNDRCGFLEFVFDDDFNFSKWNKYVFNVPMYFIKENNNYIDVTGKSFADFINGKLKNITQKKADMHDWIDHTSTVFPHVRMKNFIELRAADSVSTDLALALPAFWTGIFYDNNALAKTYDLINQWSLEDKKIMHKLSPKYGLNAQINKTSIKEIAKKLLYISENGLNNRNIANNKQQNEAVFLQPLHKIIKANKSSSDILIENYNNTKQFI